MMLLVTMNADRPKVLRLWKMLLFQSTFSLVFVPKWEYACLSARVIFRPRSVRNAIWLDGRIMQQAHTHGWAHLFMRYFITNIRHQESEFGAGYGSRTLLVHDTECWANEILVIVIATNFVWHHVTKLRKLDLSRSIRVKLEKRWTNITHWLEFTRMPSSG